MTTLPSPVLQAFHPVTFLERGAAVPFTSPLLAGARARPAERGGTELVIPNPSGGKGAYVLPWTSMQGLCRPTVHDMQLNERIAALRSVTPSGIRQAAQAVAIDGLAGREASAAAREVDVLDTAARVGANFSLLLRLVQQVEPAGVSAVPPEQERLPELELRARRAMAQAAPRFGQDPDGIASHLEEIAALLSPVGLGAQASDARLPRLLAMLAAVRREVVQWASDHGDITGEAQMIASTSQMTLACAGNALESARAGPDQMVDLLAAWRTNAPALAGRMARPDWLMDGWEQICLLWNCAKRPAERSNALREMAVLLPIIPREAGDWVGFNVDLETPLRRGRLVSLNEDWRTGESVYDAIARNEHFRSLAA